MTSYTLVRKYRSGRQQEEDTVHLIPDNDNMTVCDALKENELRTVRNIGSFIESSILCSECSECIENLC
jgi:hypothetical protein